MSTTFQAYKSYKSISCPNVDEYQTSIRTKSVSSSPSEEIIISEWQDTSELQNKLDALELENIKLAFREEELQVQLNMQSVKLKMAKEENFILLQLNNELEEELQRFKMEASESRLRLEQDISNYEYESKNLLRVRDWDQKAINRAHNQVCISKQAEDSFKSHIEKLEMQIQALAFDRTKKMNESHKAHKAETNKLKTKNKKLRQDIKDLKLRNLELQRDVAGMTQIVEEKIQQMVDMQKIFEFRQESTALSRKTFRIEDGIKSGLTSRSSIIMPRTSGLTSENFCYIFKNRSKNNFSSDDEKFEFSTNSFDSVQVLQPHLLTKELMLKVYLHLTAAAVKKKFPDVEIENSSLVKLGSDIPFWELYNFLTWYMRSLRYKESTERKSRTDEKRWFSWIRGRKQ